VSQLNDIYEKILACVPSSIGTELVLFLVSGVDDYSLGAVGVWAAMSV